NSDDDCLLYDQPGNPDILSHFTCVNGQCRHLQSLFFTGVCIRSDQECALDPQASCEVMDPSGAAPDGDGGVADDCSAPSAGGQPLTGLGANALCQRSCQDDSQCATLSANAHITYACVFGTCLPSVPFIFPCTSDQSCMPGLSCVAPPNAPPGE